MSAMPATERRCDLCGQHLVLRGFCIVEVATRYREGAVDASVGELWCSGCVRGTHARPGQPRPRAPRHG